MLDQNYMQEKLKKELDFVEEQYSFISKKFIDLGIDTINQGRNLIKDVVLISTTIAGFVIPLLLVNTGIQLNKKLLLISACCFIIVIVYGVLLRFFVLKKELENQPKALSEALHKLSEDKLTINGALRKLTQKSYVNAFKEIAERHKKEGKSEGWWKKVINHDFGFYGLFFIAIILLIISIFYKDFSTIFLKINQ